MGTAQRTGGMTTRILAAAFGAIVAVAVAGCQLTGDGPGQVDETGGASVVVQDDGYGSDGETSPDDRGSDTTDGGYEWGDTSSSGSGSGTTNEGYEAGGSTSFYDSGSITTTDDGEIIYSDDSGNSISTDF
jgi:hypothetical protein